MPTPKKRLTGNPVGRPPALASGAVRTFQTMIRLTADELAEWKAAATADGRPLGNWVRHMVEQAMANKSR